MSDQEENGVDDYNGDVGTLTSPPTNVKLNRPKLASIPIKRTASKHTPNEQLFESKNEFQISKTLYNEDVNVSIVHGKGGAGRRFKVVSTSGQEVINLHLRNIRFLLSRDENHLSFWVEDEFSVKLELVLIPTAKRQNAIDLLLSCFLTLIYHENPTMPLRILYDEGLINEVISNLHDFNDPYPLTIGVSSMKRANALKVAPSAMDHNPVRSYYRTYISLCDYYSLIPNQDFVKTISSGELAAKGKVLDIALFYTANPADLYPLIRALEFNTYFDTLILRELVIDEGLRICLRKVLYQNKTLYKLAIRKPMSFPKTLIPSLCDLLIKSSTSRIKSIEFGFTIRNPDVQPILNLAQTKKINSLRLPYGNLTKVATSQIFDSLLQTEIGENLKFLDIACSNISDKGLRALCDYLSGDIFLTGLNVAYGTISRLEDLFGALAAGCGKNLIYLDVEGNEFHVTKSVPQGFINFLAMINNLKYINLSRVNLKEVFLEAVLSALVNSQAQGLQLGLCENGFKKSAGEIFERYMPNITAITALDLNDNYFDGDVGLKSLFSGLKSNKNLNTLNLESVFKKSSLNNLPFTASTEGRDVPELDLLLTLPHLKKLSLARNNLRGALHLFLEALGSENFKLRCNIQTLNLGDNKLGDIGAQWVANMISKNISITELNVMENDIKFQGLTFLAEALENNFCLLRLFYQDKSFRDLINGKQGSVVNRVHQDIRQYLARNSASFGANSAPNDPKSPSNYMPAYHEPLKAAPPLVSAMLIKRNCSMNEKPADTEQPKAYLSAKPKSAIEAPPIMPNKPVVEIGDVHSELQRLIRILEESQTEGKNYAAMAKKLGFVGGENAIISSQTIPQLFDSIDEIITKETNEALKAVDRLAKELKQSGDRLRRGILMIMKDAAKIPESELIDPEEREEIMPLQPFNRGVKSTAQSKMKTHDSDGEYRLDLVRPPTAARPDTAMNELEEVGKMRRYQDEFNKRDSSYSAMSTSSKNIASENTSRSETRENYSGRESESAELERHSSIKNELGRQDSVKREFGRHDSVRRESRRQEAPDITYQKEQLAAEDSQNLPGTLDDWDLK